MDTFLNYQLAELIPVFFGRQEDGINIEISSEIQAEEKQRADKIQIPMAKVAADKELALKELESQAKLKSTLMLLVIHLLHIEMLNPRSCQLSWMRNE